MSRRRVVLIGTGIGIDGPEDIARDAAAAFAAEGAEVAVVQASDERARESVAAVEAAGGTAKSYINDPRDPQAIFAIAEQIGEDWPSVDTLVTHHFAADFGRLDDITVERFEETVRVNLTGAFAATKAFLPLLRRGERASIVHAGSIDGQFGNPNVLSYSASKGGVHALVHVLAAELAAEGIRVNGIARAGSTAMPLNAAVVAELGRATPLRAVAEPSEYAAVVLFLASDAASYMTGAILPVDGGRTAATPGCSPGYQGYVHA
ncbi:MAG TPA: SDR family oxidoreductase [Baekduia sp.]|nr:SDR family oxidoreductase [Baekduia sp.]